ncbi:MAG: hypothetical protein LAP40_16915 [Acidobacteriia bacterium]|nr:hypothetical protein [Terriglobia bacterium]
MAKPTNKIMTGAGGSKTRANQELAGIPDSRPFVAPEAERPEAGVDRILKCHIKGQLISTLDLDPQVLSALDYYSTDEGMAERENRPMAREASGIRLAADGFDKSLQQRRDDVKVRDMDTYQARDPLKEVADAHARPGFTPKFLSEKKVKENGSTGDYEVAKDANGDPVKVRGMVLGHAPNERVKARNRHFRERGNQALRQIGEQYKREGGSTAVIDQ